MTIFTADQFTRTERTNAKGAKVNVLVAEASELGLRATPREVWVKCQHNTLLFKHVDTEMSGEDIAGWRFRSLGGTEVLIIND